MINNYLYIYYGGANYYAGNCLKENCNTILREMVVQEKQQSATLYTLA